MEAIRIARGMPPLEWEDDAYAADDGPVRPLAVDEAAGVFLTSTEPFDRNDPVQAWCEIRHHLRTWLQVPAGIDGALSTPMGVLGDAVPGFRFRQDLVGDVVMPEALAHVLAGHGVDPRAFGAVAAWRPGKWTVNLGELRLDVDCAMAPDMETWRIGGYIHPDGIGIWDMVDGHVALYDHLPETAAQALVGEPLTRVVSHPMIDPLGLVVIGTSQWSGTVLHYRDRNVALRDIVIEE
jgi:hypothetical protein